MIKGPEGFPPSSGFYFAVKPVAENRTVPGPAGGDQDSPRHRSEELARLLNTYGYVISHRPAATCLTSSFKGAQHHVTISPSHHTQNTPVPFEFSNVVAESPDRTKEY